MKYCLAQTGSRKGDIPANIDRHLAVVDLSISHGADILIFPELSITGYEPTLAGRLAITPADRRFEIFQHRSNTHNLTIGIGAPISTAEGINIGLLLFQPGKEREIYSKQYLHPDEEPYFSSGKNTVGLLANKAAALAICYELSVPGHAQRAFLQGAEMYVASVAKPANGIIQATERLSQIAQQYGMTVLLVNCIGLHDGMECAGRSAAWNAKGELLGQLDSTHEGLLMLDTDTQSVDTFSF